MKEFFEKIFGYVPSDITPQLFGWQHFLIMAFVAGAIIGFSFLFKNKSEKTKKRVLNISAITIITLYIFDFFVQPFWDGDLVIGKLPFHICTLVGVLIPFVNFNKKFSFMKMSVVVWAILAPLAWVIFPANFLNRPVQIYSYPIVQSFVFHIFEIFWGVFMLVSGEVKLEWKKIWQPIVGLFPVAAWASLGQEMYYPGELGENFLFLKTDISAIAPQWMFIPALFIAACIAISLLFLIYYCFIWGKQAKEKRKQKRALS